MRVWWIAFGLLVFPSPLVAQKIIKGESGFLEEVSIFDPCRYRSPNGDYELRVDPDQMWGVGGSTVRLAHRGVELWEKRLPFTFGRAAVTDEGRSCGFAHTAGTLPLRTGELVVAVLEANGEVRAQRSFPRELARHPHGPTTPTASALVCEPELGRFSISVLATDKSAAREWWSFRLSDATRLDEISPRVDAKRLAAPVADDSTPQCQPAIGVTLESLGTIALEKTGETSFPDALDFLGRTLLDSSGRAFVLDSRTGCVHAFAPDGKQRYVARPDPSDEVEVKSDARLVSDDVGGVWVRQVDRPSDDAIRWVHFDGRGTRTGSVATDGDLLAARGDRIWESGSYWKSNLTERNLAGVVERTIARMGDGRWLDCADAAAMSSDGLLTVVSRGMLVSIDAEKSRAPRALPEDRPYSPRLVATPQWVILFGRFDTNVFLFRRENGASFVWEPTESDKRRDWPCGVSADHTELLTLEVPALVIHRFKLP